MFGACAGNSLGASAGNSLGQGATSVGVTGTEVPSPFIAMLERVMEEER
jgi:hypothetical protein